MDTEKPYNMIYDDTIVKYTINLPLELYAKLTQISKKERIHRSEYIRHILERELVNERPITMAELLRLEKQGQVYEPPKRYHGFANLLKRNTFYYRWFVRKSEQKY